MIGIKASDWLNKFRKRSKEEVLWKCKGSRRKFGKENFFGIPKSSDTERSLENILGKFQKFGPCLILETCDLDPLAGIIPTDLDSVQTRLALEVEVLRHSMV